MTFPHYLWKINKKKKKKKKKNNFKEVIHDITSLLRYLILEVFYNLL